MKAMELKGFSKRRRCVTTRRKPGPRVMADRVSGNFTASELNHAQGGDVNYFPFKTGKRLYLATAINFFFRKLVE